MKKILISLLMISVLLVSVGFVFAAKPTLIENGVEKGWEKTSCTTIQSGELHASDGSLITTGYDEWGYNYQAHMFNGMYCDSYRDAAWCQEWKDVELMMKWNDAWLSNVDCGGDGTSSDEKDGKLDRYYGFSSYIGSGAWLTNHQSGSYLGNWDITGDWVLDFAGGIANREFRNLVQDAEGNVVGEFWWLNSGTWEYGGTLEGAVTGDELHLYYERPPPLTYTGDFYGVIGENVITTGTFNDSHGNDLLWTATGAAIGETCNWNYFVKIVAKPDVGYDCESIWGSFCIIQQVENDACAGLNGMQYLSPTRAGLGNW